MTIVVERRRERRFLLTEAAAQRIVAAARSHLAPERGAGAAAMQTTYFDTPDGRLAAAVAAAGAGSTRARLREYQDGATFVELKYIRGAGRVKLRLPLAVDFASTWQRIVSAAPTDANLDARVAAGDLVPCLITRYARECLASDDGDLRITLDTGLEARSPIGDRVVAFGADPVLEVKSRNGYPHWLAQALHGLDDAAGFSKFRWGCAALDSRDSHRRSG